MNSQFFIGRLDERHKKMSFFKTQVFTSSFRWRWTRFWTVGSSTSMPTVTRWFTTEINPFLKQKKKKWVEAIVKLPITFSSQFNGILCNSHQMLRGSLKGNAIAMSSQLSTPHILHRKFWIFFFFEHCFSHLSRFSGNKRGAKHAILGQTVVVQTIIVHCQFAFHSLAILARKSYFSTQKRITDLWIDDNHFSVINSANQSLRQFSSISSTPSI